MSKYLRRPSPALIIAVVALVAALDGPAIASETAHIAKKITGSQIASNAITSSKVKDHSLLSKDFKSGQLPAGPQGPQGPQGAQGPQGPTGTVDTSQFYDKTTSDGRFAQIGSAGTRPAVLSNEVREPAPGANLAGAKTDPVFSVPGFGTLQLKCYEASPTATAMFLAFAPDSSATAFQFLNGETYDSPATSQSGAEDFSEQVSGASNPVGFSALVESNGSSRGITQDTVHLMRDAGSGSFQTATINVAGFVSHGEDVCQASATAVASSK
jgi:hypothetical protein